MGLASIVIISAFWVFQTTRWLLLLMNRELTAPYGDWREYELFLPAFFVYPALLLACALKGSPRLLMIAAWVTVLFTGPFAYKRRLDSSVVGEKSSARGFDRKRLFATCWFPLWVDV